MNQSGWRTKALEAFRDRLNIDKIEIRILLTCSHKVKGDMYRFIFVSDPW